MVTHHEGPPRSVILEDRDNHNINFDHAKLGGHWDGLWLIVEMPTTCLHGLIHE